MQTVSFYGRIFSGFMIAATCLLAAVGCEERAKEMATAVADDPFTIVRWVFNFLLTPTAVLVVFVILIRHIIRLVEQGFRSDSVEGYKRVCAAVLPFAMFVYAVVAERAGAKRAPNEPVHEISAWLATCSPFALLGLSAATGIGTAIEVFQRHRIPIVVLRIVLMLLSGVTCFVAFMFVSVGVSPGVNVAFGLLLGFCGTAVFLPHPTDGAESDVQKQRR